MDLLLPFGAQPLLLAAARRVLPGNFAFQQVCPRMQPPTQRPGWHACSMLRAALHQPGLSTSLPARLCLLHCHHMCTCCMQRPSTACWLGMPVRRVQLTRGMHHSSPAKLIPRAGRKVMPLPCQLAMQLHCPAFAQLPAGAAWRSRCSMCWRAHRQCHLGTDCGRRLAMTLTSHCLCWRAGGQRSVRQA